MITHFTDPSLTNIYRILQSGYLKPGIRTGKVRLYGQETPSKYIYTMVGDERNPLYEHKSFHLDISFLLDNVSYLNTGWRGKPMKNSIKLTGKMDYKELNGILNNIKKATDPRMSHEILSTKDIDLKKYLRVLVLDKQRIANAKKTYQKILTMLDKKYPKTKLILRK